MFWDGKIPSRMENGGVLKFPHTVANGSCQLCMTITFFFRTLINAFLDSTERFFSLDINKLKCSAKTWAKHWVASRTVEEWSVLVSGTSIFGTDLYLKCLGCV